MNFSFFLITSIFMLYAFPRNTVVNNKYNTNILVFIIWIFITINLYHTSRISVDMYRYLTNLEIYSNWSFSNLNRLNTTEPLFYSLAWIISNIFNNPNFFRVTIWIIISTNFFLAIKRIFAIDDILYVVYSVFSFFIFHNLATNILKQGLAVSLLVLAFSMEVRNHRNALYYTLLIIAPLFHNSALVFSLIIFMLRRIKSTKRILWIWLGSVILYLTNLNSILLSGFSDSIPYIEQYSAESLIYNYGGVNRLDFLLFSSFFIIWGVFANKKMLKNDLQFSIIFKFYILSNTVFVLSGFVAFSDRIASYSWILIPFLVWYPILQSTQNTEIKSKSVYSYVVLVCFLILSLINWKQNLFFLTH